MQVPCLAEVEALLERSHVEYIKQCIIEEEGVTVTQVLSRACNLLLKKIKLPLNIINNMTVVPDIQNHSVAASF